MERAPRLEVLRPWAFGRGVTEKAADAKATSIVRAHLGALGFGVYNLTIAPIRNPIGNKVMGKLSRKQLQILQRKSANLETLLTEKTKTCLGFRGLGTRGLKRPNPKSLKPQACAKSNLASLPC